MRDKTRLIDWLEKTIVEDGFDPWAQRHGDTIIVRVIEPDELGDLYDVTYVVAVAESSRVWSPDT